MVKTFARLLASRLYKSVIDYYISSGKKKSMKAAEVKYVD